MSNITDALDAYLTAKVRVSRWMIEFEKRWYGPLGTILVEQAVDLAKNHPFVNKDKLESGLSPQGKQRLGGK